MKQFTTEAKEAVTKKINVIRRNLDMYKKYEIELLSLQGLSETMKETGEKIPFLRKDKAREIYTIVKKYGWLSANDIGKDSYQTLMEAIGYGDLNILLQILPYAKKAYQTHKLPEEDYYQIIDYINNQKTLIENKSKTLN